MSQTCSPSIGRPYGLARTCRVLEIARSTVYARRARRLRPVPLHRRGPRPAWTDAELIEQIRGVLARSPFVGEGYRRSGRACAGVASAPAALGCCGCCCSRMTTASSRVIGI